MKTPPLYRGITSMRADGRHGSGERGSILITVVAFITLLSIALAGFLGVARNIVNQEIIECNEDKAFLAAESGLLIGTRWLQEGNNWAQYYASGYNGNVYEGALNGFDVDVAVTKLPSGDLQIRATSASNELPYSKRLSWTVRENNYGIFINDFSQSGGVGGGGLNNEWFDGPLHSNTPVYVSSVSGGNVSVKFVNGKVSVHNMTSHITFANGGHWGNYGVSNVSGNDYDFGIHHHSAQPGQFSKLDPLFTNNGVYTQFQHSQDLLFMSPVGTQTITLPQNHASASAAILYFYVQNGTGKAEYFYHNAGNAADTLTFNIHNQVIRVPNDVGLLGTVKGQTTVVTDPGCHIKPIGDLTYANFQPDYGDMDNYDNAGNYGLGAYGPLNNDVIALVSGGDINFGLDKYQISVSGKTATLTAVPSHGNKKPEMVVTAQLFATGQGHGIRWASTNVNQYNYRLYALGTRAIDVYTESHNAQGGPGHETFTFLYDTRFNNAAFRAPGSPSLRTASSSSGGPFIVNTNWTEENIL